MIRASFRAPGQFVHIRCGEGLLLRRPISVCSCMEDEPDDLLSIVFEVRGEGTRWLAGRELGDSLDVLGLAGNGFDLKPEGRYLLVGGGIGIPPMLGCGAGKRSTLGMSAPTSSHSAQKSTPNSRAVIATARAGETKQ